MENFKTVILKNNNKVLNNLNLKQQGKISNCRKEIRPLNNNCLANDLLSYYKKNWHNKLNEGSKASHLKIDIAIIRQALIINKKT